MATCHSNKAAGDDDNKGDVTTMLHSKWLPCLPHGIFRASNKNDNHDYDDSSRQFALRKDEYGKFFRLNIRTAQFRPRARR